MHIEIPWFGHTRIDIDLGHGGPHTTFSQIYLISIDKIWLTDDNEVEFAKILWAW